VSFLGVGGYRLLVAREGRRLRLLEDLAGVVGVALGGVRDDVDGVAARFHGHVGGGGDVAGERLTTASTSSEAKASRRTIVRKSVAVSKRESGGLKCA